MLISAAKLTKLPIVDSNSYQRLGVVERAIFNPDTGKLAYLAVRPQALFSEQRYLALRDIELFDQHAVISREEDLLELDDLPRLQQLTKEKRPILHQLAADQDQHAFGRINDVLFDEHGGQIVQIYVHALLTNRIFSFRQIDSVTKEAVIIKYQNTVSETKEETVSSATARSA